MLDTQDFECLVRGGILRIPKHNLVIALSDIGFYEMDKAIEKANDKVDLYKDHVKEV